MESDGGENMELITQPNYKSGDCKIVAVFHDECKFRANVDIRFARILEDSQVLKSKSKGRGYITYSL